MVFKWLSNIGGKKICGRSVWEITWMKYMPGIKNIDPNISSNTAKYVLRNCQQLCHPQETKNMTVIHSTVQRTL
jgi:hypothetical protein